MLQVREPSPPTMDYYIPQWEERTSYGMRRIDPYTKLFEDRIIFLGTPISDEIANAVMAQLLCLQQMDPDRDIEIYINSPGGSFTALTAIYDTMRYIKPDVQHGLPRSGRLGRRGDPGRRHQGQAARAAEQPDPDPPAGDRGRLRPVLRHRDPGAEILRIRSLMEEMLADDTGKTHRGGQPRHRARQVPDRRAGPRVRHHRRGPDLAQGRPGRADTSRPDGRSDVSRRHPSRRRAQRVDSATGYGRG